MEKELNKFRLIRVKQEKFQNNQISSSKIYEQCKDKTAAVCVMDVYNGDIISLVSSPTFEPNEFVHGLDSKYGKA